MKKSALISVLSKQSDGEEDKIEVVTPGRFYEKDGKYYVIYEETEISGMEGTTTKIKIEEDQFVLTRKGTTNTRMTFQNNLNDVIMYHTPHGMLQLAISVKKVEIDVDETGGTIYAEYDMSVSPDQIIQTEIRVIIKI